MMKRTRMKKKRTRMRTTAKMTLMLGEEQHEEKTEKSKKTNARKSFDSNFEIWSTKRTIMINH